MFCFTGCHKLRISWIFALPSSQLSWQNSIQFLWTWKFGAKNLIRGLQRIVRAKNMFHWSYIKIELHFLLNIGYLFQRICIASSFLSLYMNTFYLTFVPAMVGVYVQLYKYSLFYMQASKRKQNILKTKCPSKWEGSDGIILINEINTSYNIQLWPSLKLKIGVVGWGTNLSKA